MNHGNLSTDFFDFLTLKSRLSEAGLHDIMPNLIKAVKEERLPLDNIALLLFRDTVGLLCVDNMSGFRSRGALGSEADGGARLA